MDFATALDACRRPANLKRTLTIAVVVGTVLSLINEGSLIFHGAVTDGTAWKIGLNYVVPFVVSNLGVLTATHTATG